VSAVSSSWKKPLSPLRRSNGSAGENYCTNKKTSSLQPEEWVLLKPDFGGKRWKDCTEGAMLEWDGVISVSFEISQNTRRGSSPFNFVLCPLPPSQPPGYV
jgi:hypothetical protein